MRVSSVVAVVDVCDAAPVVWWADLGLGNLGLQRLGGAWVLDSAARLEDLSHLIAGRLVVATAAGQGLLREQSIVGAGMLDVTAIRAAVGAEADRLQAIFEDAAAKPGKSNLVAPAWPAIPSELDVETASAQAGDPTASRALAIARHLAALCDAWDQIEQQRLARSYMRGHGGDQARPLPLGLSSLFLPAQPVGAGKQLTQPV